MLITKKRPASRINKMLNLSDLLAVYTPPCFSFTSQNIANYKRQKSILRRNSQLNSFMFFFKEKSGK